MLAQASLAVGIAVGLALGIGRMAAGGHFLSDVVWSAVLAYGICHILYFHALRLDGHEGPDTSVLPAHPPQDRWHRLTAILVALGGIAVLAALFATPHGSQIATKIRISALPRAPRVVAFEARSMDIEIVVLDSPAAEISVVGELHGFGLPGSRLRAVYEYELDHGPALIYRIEQQGWFTDLDGAATMLLPAAGLERLVVRLRHGNIRIRDQTHDGRVGKGDVQLDLRTADGHVQAPALTR
jgi:hypothetical protein